MATSANTPGQSTGQDSAKNPFDQQQLVPGVKKIIAVGSGKGGVGKSTVSINLALALKNQGLKVGLLDADIYGPSMPRMLGTLSLKPKMTDNNKLEPIEKYGLKTMSIGYLVDEESAIVWRGPMLFKAINQFLFDMAWDDVDVLVIDLPPGTGDVQLSLAQKAKIDGAVIVTTPQNVSLIDAKKAIDMFERTSIPIMGVIENMSYLEKDGERIQLFPKGDLDKFIGERDNKIEKLAELPFHSDLGVAGEIGLPLFETKKDHAMCTVFNKLAEDLKGRLF